jgi:RimJ/RimL family protein N-acetyltransferase
MLNIKPRILSGSWLQLEPFTESHRDDLYTVAQDEAIWTYNGAKAFGDRFYRWFDKAMQCLQQQNHLPFVVRRLADQKIIGSTRYYDITAEHHRLAIGYTWYVPEVWGSYVNPECKYLLLQHAFEDLQAHRVEFITDSRHSRSRAALKKVGATEEGVLRAHIVLEDGFIRDSVVFSILNSEWTPIKNKLESRLKMFAL